MTISPSRAGDARVKRLTTALYVYTFLDDFVLLYPVYALLFADTGLSVAEISSLFVIWSITGVLLEVPSGVWADAVSRRLLLSVGPLLGSVGYMLWIAIPGYWAFALGFVLWGARGALQSGAMEALLYEELDHLGAAGQYARTMGRARAIGLCAVAVATGVAAPVFAVGGYLAVGLASVVAGLLCAAVAMAFPEHLSRARLEGVGNGHGASAGDGDEEDEGEGNGYIATLRVGLAETRGNRSVRRAVLLIPVVTALWGALEEYTSLLASDTGVSVPVVSLLELLVWAGAMSGGLLAPVGQRMTARAFAGTLALAALALGTGAISRQPVGFVLIAVAFGGFQMASVVADARLQERITGTSRATVTSLAGLGTDLTTVLVYGAYAAASQFAAHSLIFTLFAVPYVLVAWVLARRPPRMGWL